MSRILLKTLVASTALTMCPSLASADPTIVKNVIVMIADGAGYNTLEGTRDFLGSGLVMDGAGWTQVAQSTYPLSGRTAPVAGAAGLVQDPSDVYDSAKAWNTIPKAGNSTVPGYTSYPASFEGYE